MAVAYAAGVRIVRDEPSHRVAVLGPVLIALFRAGPTEASVVRGWDKAMRELAPEHSKVLFFGVIEEASAPPDDPTRAALADFYERHAASIVGVVVTVEGTGFRAAMARTIVTTVMHVMPRFRFKFPRHVCSNADEAAARAHQLMPTLDTAGLLRALAELRAPR